VTLWSSEEAAAAYERGAEGQPLQAEFVHAVEAGTFHLTRYATLD